MENPSPLPLLHDTKVSGVHIDPVMALGGHFAAMAHRGQVRLGVSATLVRPRWGLGQVSYVLHTVRWFPAR